MHLPKLALFFTIDYLSIHNKLFTMNTEQIKQVIENEALPDTCTNVDLLETLNSWLIRTDNNAFKIRKPTQSNGRMLLNIEERKMLCLKELDLNRKLAHAIYKDVIPVRKLGKKSPSTKNISDNVQVIDYALHMKKLDDNDKLLVRIKERNLTKIALKNLAKRIAEFHKQAEVIKNAFNIKSFQREYNEIERCDYFISELLGGKYLQLMYESMQSIQLFLGKNRYQIHERTIAGFIRDGHGELSAENIYMGKKKAITDRIALYDEQRYVDLLFDIARLGIDFDYYGLENMGEVFFQEYLNCLGETKTPGLINLYTFYKLYRTGRLITQNIDETTIFQFTDSGKNKLLRYFDLLKKYMQFLQRKKQ
jgi:uncharacterized protein